MKCIGYTGCEAFDLILYTGRILSKLKYKVLVVDLSETGALWTSVNHGLGLDSSKEVVFYRGIYYLRRIPRDDELKEFQEGIVFVNFGMNYRSDFPVELHRLYLVVTPFPHIVETVKELQEEKIEDSSKCNLLIRDARNVDDIDIVLDAMKPRNNFAQVSFLYHDISDYESALNCQMSKVIRFTRISPRMKKCIRQQIKEILPQLRAEKISRAMVVAKWGA